MPEALEVTAGPLVAGGDSLVRRTDEKVMFVEGALPGELISAEIVRERKDLIQAKAVKIISASDVRISAPCPMFHAGCGGCQWQHAAEAAQHEFKVDIVRDALRRIAKRPHAPVSFAGAVSPFGYRTSMRVSIVDGQAALHHRHSKDLQPLDLCQVAHPLLEELIVEGRFGSATEVSLRVSLATGERLALVTGDAADVVLPPDVRVTTGRDDASIHEEVQGRRFRVSAQSFFQSGQEAADLLAQTVSGAVTGNVTWLIDAYAGVGILGGLVAAETGAKVSAIEQSMSSVNDARVNLKDLNAEVIEAEVAGVSLAAKTSPELVIADPARSGLGRSATATLANLGAKQFILVSCDPASLARDVNLLAEHSYSLKSVEVLDLFPQTHHVETVSVFDRK